jgi:hypothetical protein
LEGRNSCGKKTIVLQNTTSRRGKNRGETEITKRKWKLDFEKKERGKQSFRDKTTTVWN